MSSEGFLPLFRSIRNSWQWKKPLWRSAWVWLLIEARYADGNGLKRGQVRGSLSYFAKAWGMTKKQARTFLTECVKHHDAQWQRGKGGHFLCCSQGTAEGTAEEPAEGTAEGTALSVVTLCNYEKYRALFVGNGTAEEPALEPAEGSALGPNHKQGIETKKETKKKTTTRTPRSTGKPPIAKTLEEVDQEIGSIIIADFFRQYEPQGLDVAQCFDSWREYCRGEKPSNPVINPGKFCLGYFGKAFHNACKGAIKRGYHLLKDKESPTYQKRQPAKNGGDDGNELARKIANNRKQALGGDF